MFNKLFLESNNNCAEFVIMQKLLRLIKNKLAINSPFLELIIYYLAGRRGGTRRINAENAVKETSDKIALFNKYDKDVLPVVWDFGARPYALGDILTTLIDWAVYANKLNRKAIDIFVLVDPTRPASHKQSYVNEQNYHQFMMELLPVFYYCPLLRNVSFIHDRNAMEQQLLQWNLQGITSIPTLNDYNDELNNQQPFRGIFNNIKQFFLEHGNVPKYRYLKCENPLKDQLLFGFKPNTVFVAVHIRQRHKEVQSVSGGALYRDADLSTWLTFIQQAQIEHPNVVFIIVGRLAEFSRQLYRLNNVVILKHLGMGLIDELNAIQHADFFMGGISGPAMFAMFTNTPYVLFQTDANKNETAEYLCEPVGEEHPFFCTDKQKIVWGEPDANILMLELKTFLNS